MPSIEERVVGMRFDNSGLDKGLKPAIDGLDKLKQSLKMEGATKGLEEVDAAGKRFSLDGIGSGVEVVSGKFIALATIGITALSNIVNKAVDAGQRIISSLTIDPVKAGLDEYELTMGSIQTILANTSKYGTKLQDVTGALDELNTYADKTIYNFGDMTKNIGLFTNAGMKIEDAVANIKGFSNEAAASGVSAANAAGAAYQLSQAMSAGTVRLMDWKSLTNAGMGNKNMQNGLIEIADAMGTFSNGTATATSAGKDFNSSLEQNWLSADVMSNYLKIMAGDMDDATMASLGLSDATIASFKQQQKTAEEAATKVRTWTQLIGTMQEAVGSGWSQSFKIIIGDFNEATDLFTTVNNTLGGMIGAASDARNKVLQDWSDNGGRAAAISAISSAFKILMSILGPIAKAFQEVFPPVTGKQLADITKQIQVFVESLQPGKEALDQIGRTAKGFFAVLDIGWQIIKAFGTMLFDVLGFAGKGSGGILEFTAKVGDFLVRVDEAIKKGEGFSKFFTVVGNGIKFALGFLKNLVGAIFDLIGASGDVAKSGFGGWIDSLKERMQPLGSIIDGIKSGFHGLIVVVEAVAAFFAPLAQKIGDALKGIGPAIASSFSSGNFDSVMSLIDTGLLAGIGVLIFKFIDKMKGTLKSLNPGGGIVDSIKNVFGGLTDTLTAMQGQIKAKTLLTIAAAVGVLTLSVVALSFIDVGKLAIALGAITVMFTQLGAVMAAFDKMFSTSDAVKLTVLGAALILLATGMTIFAAAIAILAAIPTEDLIKGLVGMGAALAIVSGAMLLLSKAGPGAILGSAALVIASVGLIIIAGALKLFATMSWDDIGRAMATLGATLAILAVGLTLMAGTLPGSAALVIASVGILIIAAALKIFSTLSWDDIGRAMATLGSTLAILAVGLTLMVAALPGAAALVVASVGLAVMAGVLKIFATLNWDDIGRAMVLLGGTLLILAVGLTAMVAALPGAAALVVAAAALTVLAPILAFLGSLSWETIWTGLGALALVLATLAIAGIALIPAIPGLVGLGIAIALLGVGVLAAGIGVAALAVGLTALSIAGGAAITVLIAAVTGLAGLIPYVAQQIGLGMIEILKVIASAGPQILETITVLLLALIAAIVAIIPPAIEAIVLLVTKLVEALIVLIPLLVDAGMKIIIGILDGIAKNIGKVIEKGTDIIVNLLEGIGKAIPRLLTAGANLIIDFVNGIASTIRRKSGELQDAGLNVASAIVEGMTGGLTKGVGRVIAAAQKLVANIAPAIKKLLGINSPSKVTTELGEYTGEGVGVGITNRTKFVERSATDLGDAAVSSLKKAMAQAGNEMSLGMDTAPTIRPVLDLSGLKKDAGLISGIVGSKSISVDTATARANEIANKYGEYQQAVAEGSGPSTEVNMTQNNYSPVALPAAEIYRQNKNQMSILKEELSK